MISKQPSTEIAKSKLSVVMIIQTFFPFIGGAEKQCLQLSKTLQERGVKVKVFTEHWKGFLGFEVIDGIEVRRLGRGGPRLFHSIFFMVSIFTYLLVRGEGYNVIHVHLAASHAVAAALFGKILRKKVFIKIGGGNAVGEIALSKKTFKGRMKLRALGFLRAPFILMNPDQKQELHGFGLEKVPTMVIPNGVDLDTYNPAPPEEKDRLRKELGWSGFVFLYTGRFSNDKITVPVLENFLTAWKNVAATRKDISFVLVGQGPLEKEYSETIQRFNLGNSVHLWPARNKISQLYKAANAFVLPSMTEGLSNSLLEAMASNLPVLASRVSGIVDIIQEPTHGYLFDPLSPQDIERGLRTLLEQPTSRLEDMGHQARIAAVHYSIDKTVERFLNLYGE